MARFLSSSTALGKPRKSPGNRPLGRVRVYLTTEKNPTSGDHVGAERRRRTAPPPNPVLLEDSEHTRVNSRPGLCIAITKLDDSGEFLREK